MLYFPEVETSLQTGCLSQTHVGVVPLSKCKTTSGVLGMRLQGVKGSKRYPPFSFLQIFLQSFGNVQKSTRAQKHKAVSNYLWHNESPSNEG